MSDSENNSYCAIVTGASGGIGRACAVALARRLKIPVALQFNSNPNSAEDAANEIQSFGGSARVFQADLSKPGEAEKLVAACAEQFGAPAIIVHAAGHLLEKPIAFTKPEEWDALFELHVLSAAALLKALSRHLRKTQHGRVVLIGSLAGCVGLANGAAYAAAKGALEGLCKSFALEAAHWQTTVNVIAPGFVDTHMTEATTPERREATLQNIPLKRYGSAGEIAELAVFLCSTEAAYITGQTIVADGGASLKL